MQRQKIFFIFLISLGAAVAAFFSIQSAEAIYGFLTLKKEARGRAEKWEIKEENGKFPLTCYYFFEANGATWQGRSVLAKPWHLNETSAIEALKVKAKEDLIVWFNPNRPDKSTLERKFPTSLLIRTCLSYGVLLYFLFLFRNYAKGLFTFSMSRKSILS